MRPASLTSLWEPLAPRTTRVTVVPVARHGAASAQWHGGVVPCAHRKNPTESPPCPARGPGRVLAPPVLAAPRAPALRRGPADSFVDTTAETPRQSVGDPSPAALVSRPALERAEKTCQPRHPRFGSGTGARAST